MKYYEIYPKYRRSLYFFYSSENGIDGFMLCKGVKVEVKEELIYNVVKIDDYISTYDFLPYSSGPPLVSQRFRDTFIDLERDKQIEYYNCVIIDDKGNKNTDFLVLNILSSYQGLDKDKSVSETDEFGIFTIKKLALNPNFMKGSMITRLEEKKSIIIVNDEFKKVFKENKLKGIDFVE